MISVAVAELSAAAAAAVVRPVSAEWEAVTPASRRVEKAAGPDVERHRRALGELPVGSAVVTPGGAIAADFIIHVVVRSRDEPVSASGVARGIETALRRLVEWGIASAAFAPLGTGAGNLDAEEAARLMIPRLLAHVGHEAHPERVEIIVETEYERDVFAAELRRASGGESGTR